MGERPAVWVEDAHPIFRRGLATSLSAAGLDVVGESADWAPEPSWGDVDVVIFAADPDCMDVVADHGSSDALVATVDPTQDALIADLVEAGVRAVLPRAELRPRLLEATVRSVALGTATLPPVVLRGLLDRAAQAGGPSHGLCDREVEVLRLLADGADTREIADTMCYSDRTVKNVVHDVLMKLNCRNRTHAVAVAIRQGVI